MYSANDEFMPAENRGEKGDIAGHKGNGAKKNVAPWIGKPQPASFYGSGKEKRN